MIKTEGEVTTITCDKCGRYSIAPKSMYNKIFFEEGWALNRGRKYEHLCNPCLPAKSRKAMAFVKEKFGCN
jgi:hypothetical protein